MATKFIFDVDGTLTPSRGIIDPNFKDWFTRFIKQNDVYLVTGSDYPKTVEQLGTEICELVKRVYNCSGNDVWEAGQNIYTNSWHLEDAPCDWLSERLCESEFRLRTGQHFEHRPGMCNFSIVGRGATQDQRNEYVKYDTETHERERIAYAFNVLFPLLSAKVGGETGLDIFPTGRDKSQIIKDFNPKDTLIFFGDKMDPNGNDYPLAKEVLKREDGCCYSTRGWEDTWRELVHFTEINFASI